MAVQVNTRTVQVNNTLLTYIERGAGQPVIFVHGSQGDYRTWVNMVDAFSQKYRAIAYSRRYHYPNPVNGEITDYTVFLHADDLIAFIEGLHLAPAFVVGNSFGAYTTLVAALRRPDLMRKIVVGEPPILQWLKDLPEGQAYYNGFLKNAWLPAKQAFQNGNMEQGLQFFVDGVSEKGNYERLPESVKKRFLDNTAELKAETLSPDYFLGITPVEVEQIRLPVLLLKGENSPKMFHLVVELLAKHLPNYREETIPNASHAMYSGNPQAYQEVVQEFLESK